MDKTFLVDFSKTAGVCLAVRPGPPMREDDEGMVLTFNDTQGSVTIKLRAASEDDARARAALALSVLL